MLDEKVLGCPAEVPQGAGDRGECARLPHPDEGPARHRRHLPAAEAAGPEPGSTPETAQTGPEPPR